MRKLITLLLCYSVMNSYAGDMGDFPKQISEELGLTSYSSGDLHEIEFKGQAATIFTILLFTHESNIHQLDGQTGNRVFLSEDGHSEAVYDAEGQLVTECLNEGSYNYYHPYQNPLGHFTADILPWLIWGNCVEDPSTKDQRIKAYIEDLKAGFNHVVNNNQNFILPEGFAFEGYGQSVAISFFLKALETSAFDFSTFVPEKIHDKKQQAAFFKALENGFKLLLKNA